MSICTASTFRPVEGQTYCTLSGSLCHYIVPNSERCAREFNQGPLSTPVITELSEMIVSAIPPINNTRKCKDCEELFTISIEEAHWLGTRGLGLFVRCKKCRDKRKDEQNDSN